MNFRFCDICKDIFFLFKVVVYQMRDVFPSKLTKQKMYKFFCEFSVRLSLSGPHFNLSKANECILLYIKTDLLLEEYKMSQESRLRGLVWSSTDPEISALESSSPVEVTSSIMRVFDVSAIKVIFNFSTFF